jgi:hypothetical protein
MIVTLFHALVVVHIVTGLTGLVAFWGPVLTRKGGPAHRRWGLLFARSMIVTGSVAIAISLCSLAAPLATHKDFTDAALARGLFGWMMLFLATLTISLGFHALQSIRSRGDHAARRTPPAIGLQLAVIATAAICLWRGVALGQPLMIGIAMIGFASGGLTLAFLAKQTPGRLDPLLEHIRAGVGAGISAYTAFLSVGLVRLTPDHAFNPALWAIPILIGVGLIVYHQRRVRGPGAVKPGPVTS